ncbi:hypothetical protein BMS3Abin16_01883 [archaeon BMS3Abin16]|nr:hypothetical protein BMS3Abin16_01883 [archaeon BMS3Abin16]
MREIAPTESSPIDWKRYEKMTLPEKWAYLNEKSREIYASVEKLIDR